MTRKEKKLKWLNHFISRLEAGIKDPHNFIYEYFYLIRNRIDLTVENILIESEIEKTNESKIRSVHEKMINRLVELEQECLANLNGQPKILDVKLDEKDKSKITDLNSMLNDQDFVQVFLSDAESWNEWIKQKDAREKFFSIENELKNLMAKLNFILLMGHYVKFVGLKSKEENFYKFSSDKLKIFSVNDYTITYDWSEKEKDLILEQIYLYEHKLNIRINEIHDKMDQIFSKLHYTNEIKRLLKLINKLSIPKPVDCRDDIDSFLIFPSQKLTANLKYAYSPNAFNSKKFREELAFVLYLICNNEYEIYLTNLIEKMEKLFDHGVLLSKDVNHAIEIIRLNDPFIETTSLETKLESKQNEISLMSYTRHADARNNMTNILKE